MAMQPMPTVAQLRRAATRVEDNVTFTCRQALEQVGIDLDALLGVLPQHLRDEFWLLRNYVRTAAIPQSRAQFLRNCADWLEQGAGPPVADEASPTLPTDWADTWYCGLRCTAHDD